MRKIPTNLPQEIEIKIELLRQVNSQEECLQKAYELLIKKYHGNRLKTLTHFFELFSRSLEELWARDGFMHCTNLNWLLRTLLVRSGHFTEHDITAHWTLLWYVSPHQYLRVTMKDGRRVNVDTWAHTYGIPFGDYAHGFHAYGNSSS